ncbi:uncharacterized protein LOC123658893 [Melitaea cinxia]|uniref:uncharacterized protein LOC123658893 n=1 Tax=Melitaea cinxia TaxID=113334 RepID=UPI001E272383|nr:uncharacterized protein LOC123658893 [Melitaea cinxia]
MNPKDDKLKEHFTIEQNKVNKLIKRLKKQYYLNAFENCRRKPKKIFKPCTSLEVLKIINNLDSNSSSGIDQINTKTLKCIKDLIVDELVACINKCLDEGSFPDSLKIAKVSPIYKSDLKTDPSNYRPISVLPVLSKIFEKILYTRIYQHLNDIDYLSKKQYGFRPKSNTLAATIDLVSNIKSAIDKKQVAVGIFIDIKKAFDAILKPSKRNKDRSPLLPMTFSAKLRTQIGCWNVRTMTQPERLPQVAKIMRDYSIHILGLSETRWNGFGEITSDFDSTLLYSGKEDENATREYGAGLVLSRSVKNSLLSWNPISERIITARFSSRVRKITVIQCYAPTNSALPDEKESFYEQVESTLKSTKKQDIVILMGDLNAKMGSDNEDREHYMGREGAAGVINENGELFGDLCSAQDLVIGGTLFKHKECDKITWISLDGVTQNQIDHISISRAWRTSLLDVRNRRGADADSDHHLVVADVRLRMAAARRKVEKASKKFNLQFLRSEEGRKEFSICLRNQFELLKDLEDEDMDEAWEHMRTAFTKAGEKALGYKHSKQEHWMSHELWSAKRQNIKLDVLAALDEEYAAMRLQIRKLARRDIRRAADELADRANAAAKVLNMRELYDVTKRLCNKSRPSKKPLKDATGQLLCTTEEQLKRWTEHFSNLLTQCQTQPTTVPNSPGPLLNLPTTPPTYAEVVAAIKHH